MQAVFLCDNESSLEIEQAININKHRKALFINLWLIRIAHNVITAYCIHNFKVFWVSIIWKVRSNKTK